MQFRKIKFFTILFSLLFFALPIFAQSFVYVSVEKADLKSGTGKTSEKITTLEYGTKLILLENTLDDKWIKVAKSDNEKIRGWILSSEVTKRKIVKFMDNLSSSEKEQALAGKGSSIDKTGGPAQKTSPKSSTVPKTSPVQNPSPAQKPSPNKNGTYTVK